LNAFGLIAPLSGFQESSFLAFSGSLAPTPPFENAPWIFRNGGLGFRKRPPKRELKTITLSINPWGIADPHRYDSLVP